MASSLLVIAARQFHVNHKCMFTCVSLGLYRYFSNWSCVFSSVGTGKFISVSVGFIHPSVRKSDCVTSFLSLPVRVLTVFIDI